ncbi:MAG: prepilin-type N-terminal cleavage/methylation domain-containing protein [Verrucomicrobia bacterium]|nr:prepilin-type N-terminal cleavage/methylation domain-containing protein [Verrucomicrobiota bacterium]
MKTNILKGSSSRSTRSGFTLMELLVASVAFAMIVLVIKVTLMESMEMRERGQKRMDQLNTRMRIMEIIESDLKQCMLKETSFAQEFRGETVSGAMTRTDQLEFYTASGIIQTNQPWGHLQKVRYYLQQPIYEGRSEMAEGYTLYREVTRNLLPATDSIVNPQAIANEIASLKFQYYDGEYWQETWDSTVDESKLPKAVRVRVEFLREDANGQLANRPNNIPYPSLQTTVALLATPQIEEESEDGTTQTDNNTNGR